MTTEVTGARRPLPPGVDRAAYRIVQEAVTNVHRHAGAGTASVHVDYGDWLTVQVDDDGRGGAPDADGVGQRHHRHARAGGRRGRVAGGGAAARGRVPGARPAAAAGRHVTSVLLADDQALVRAGFRVLLESQDDIEVVGEAADGARGGRPGAPATAPTWC